MLAHKAAPMDLRPPQLSAAGAVEAENVLHLGFLIGRGQEQAIAPQARRSVTAARHVEVMREALQLTEKAFRAGSGSSLDVTDARKSTAAAEINLITSGLKVQSALLSLLHAAGKDIATIVR